MANAVANESDAATSLEKAIAKLTTMLGMTEDPETAKELVAERRAMRAELEALRRQVAGVVDLESRRRR